MFFFIYKFTAEFICIFTFSSFYYIIQCYVVSDKIRNWEKYANNWVITMQLWTNGFRCYFHFVILRRNKSVSLEITSLYKNLCTDLQQDLLHSTCAKCIVHEIEFEISCRSLMEHAISIIGIINNGYCVVAMEHAFIGELMYTIIILFSCGSRAYVWFTNRTVISFVLPVYLVRRETQRIQKCPVATPSASCIR